MSDPGLHHHAEVMARSMGVDMHTLERIAAGLGAAFVVVVGWYFRRRHAAEAH